MRLFCVHVFLVLLISNICDSQFHQDDYDLHPERIEIMAVNKTVAPFLELKVYQYNNTVEMKVVNFTVDFKSQVRKNILLTFVVYKMVKNIYRPIPAANITLDICEEYKRLGERNPLGIQVAIDKSNFHGCPVPSGIYYIDSWLLDQEKLPPHAPSGAYKLAVRAVVDDNIYIFDADCFGTVNKRKKKKH